MIPECKQLNSLCGLKVFPFVDILFIHYLICSSPRERQVRAGMRAVLRGGVRQAEHPDACSHPGGASCLLCSSLLGALSVGWVP